MTFRPHEDGEPCHCEEPEATKQSLFQAKIASLRSQYGCCYRICRGQGVQVLEDSRMRLLHEPDNVGIENVSGHVAAVRCCCRLAARSAKCWLCS